MSTEILSPQCECQGGLEKQCGLTGMPWTNGYAMDYEGRPMWNQILILPFNSCGTLSFSKPQCPILKTWVGQFLLKGGCLLAQFP